MNANDKIVRKRERRMQALRVKTPKRIDTVVESGFITNTGSSFQEKRSYLLIEPDIDSETLRKDVKNGATPYEVITRAMDIDLGSRVTVIRSRDEESALMFVTYLAAIHNELDGISRDDYVDADCAENEDPCDCVNLYPIIMSSELECDRFVPYGDGGFGSNMTQNARGTKREKRFFDFQKTEPVIVIRHYDDFGFPSETLLDEFRANRRVYLCYIQPRFISFETDIETGLDQEEKDASVSEAELKLIMRYDAAVFTITNNKNRMMSYYMRILDSVGEYYGVRWERDFNRLQFIEKLVSIVQDNRAYTIDRLVYREGRRSRNNTVGKGLFTLIGKMDDRNVPGKLKGWDLINSLIGMEDVKKTLHSYVDSMLYASARKMHHEKTNMPVVLEFVGNPGVAKTTVAEGLADVLFENGILPGRRFISISGAQLQAPYLGQSALKTHSVFAEHDLIFIDEAYALGESKESLYCREILSQLCVELETAAREQNKVVIFAGYGGNESDEKSNKMLEFLNANPGIASRIGCVLNFPSYSPEECVRITYGIIRNEGYELTEAVKDSLYWKLLEHFNRWVRLESFGNGRTCRNLVMHAERKAAERVVQGRKINELDPGELRNLTCEDILGAVEEMDRMEQTSRGRTVNRIGFSS